MVNEILSTLNGKLEILDVFIAKNDFDDATKKIKKTIPIESIKINIIATHSGFVNRNKVLYTDNLLINSVETLIEKPIMVNHSIDQNDTIGRVYAADFIKIENPEIGMPTGYIKIKATIYGEDNVKKVLNKIHYTVSIRSVSTESTIATCSICNEKFKTSTEISEHEHQKGEIYDGRQCYIILDGAFDYRHVAFVPEPADEDAKVEQIYQDSVDRHPVTSEVMMPNEKDKNTKNQKPGEQDDSVETDDVTNEDNKDKESNSGASENDENGANSDNTVDPKDTNKDDSENSSDENSDEDSKDSENDKSEDKTKDKSKTDDNEDDKDSEETTDDSEEDSVLTFEDLSEDDHNEYIRLDMMIDHLINEDAKLTAAARKKLKDSDFCGPDRTFPAHNCTHAVQGLRLLEKSNLSDSQKGKTKTCLLQKRKRLCNTEDSANENNIDEETLNTVKALLDTKVGKAYIADNFYRKADVDNIIQKSIDKMMSTMEDATVQGKYKALKAQYADLEDKYTQTVYNLADTKLRALQVIKYVVDDSINDVANAQVLNDEVLNFTDSVNKILADYDGSDIDESEQDDNSNDDSNLENDHESRTLIKRFEDLSYDEKNKLLSQMINK